MRDIVRFSNELMNMKRNIDRVFENFFKPEKTKSYQDDDSSTLFVPPVNAVENNTEIIIYALIPFAKKEDISLNIKDGVLTIEGKNSFELKDGSELLRDEIPCGKFSRSFKVGTSIDPSKIKASYRDGILQITLPKKEEAKTNKIEIE